MACAVVRVVAPESRGSCRGEALPPYLCVRFLCSASTFRAKREVYHEHDLQEPRQGTCLCRFEGEAACPIDDSGPEKQPGPGATLEHSEWHAEVAAFGILNKKANCLGAPPAAKGNLIMLDADACKYLPHCSECDEPNSHMNRA